MDFSNQGNDLNSSPNPNIPVKKKRGRPRKDQNQNLGIAENLLPARDQIQGHGDYSQVPPGFVRVKEENPHQENPVQHTVDAMVGQAVNGVVEAAFDTGYFLSVRIGNSETILRGIVFKPGHYFPVLSSHDLTPHFQMLSRNVGTGPLNGCSNLGSDSGSGSGSARGRGRGRGGGRGRGRGRARKDTHLPFSGNESSAGNQIVNLLGNRGNLVPVVLEPANLLNGSVPTVKSPPTVSRPANQMQHIQLEKVLEKDDGPGKLVTVVHEPANLSNGASPTIETRPAISQPSHLAPSKGKSVNQTYHKQVEKDLEEDNSPASLVTVAHEAANLSNVTATTIEIQPAISQPAHHEASKGKSVDQIHRKQVEKDQEKDNSPANLVTVAHEPAKLSNVTATAIEIRPAISQPAHLVASEGKSVDKIHRNQVEKIQEKDNIPANLVTVAHEAANLSNSTATTIEIQPAIFQPARLVASEGKSDDQIHCKQAEKIEEKDNSPANLVTVAHEPANLSNLTTTTIETRPAISQPAHLAASEGKLVNQIHHKQVEKDLDKDNSPAKLVTVVHEHAVLSNVTPTTIEIRPAISQPPHLAASRGKSVNQIQIQHKQLDKDQEKCSGLGNLVPLVLQPVNVSNGMAPTIEPSPGISQPPHLAKSKGKSVNQTQHKQLEKDIEKHNSPCNLAPVVLEPVNVSNGVAPPIGTPPAVSQLAHLAASKGKSVRKTQHKRLKKDLEKDNGPPAFKFPVVKEDLVSHVLNRIAGSSRSNETRNESEKSSGAIANEQKSEPFLANPPHQAIFSDPFKQFSAVPQNFRDPRSGMIVEPFMVKPLQAIFSNPINQYLTVPQNFQDGRPGKMTELLMGNVMGGNQAFGVQHHSFSQH